jgi:hypothetical protein
MIARTARRRVGFPGLAANAKARECAQTMAAWKLLPTAPRSDQAAASRKGRPPG